MLTYYLINSVIKGGYILYFKKLIKKLNILIS